MTKWKVKVHHYNGLFTVLIKIQFLVLRVNLHLMSNKKYFRKMCILLRINIRTRKN